MGNMHPKNIVFQLVFLVRLRIRENINELETKTVDQGVGQFTTEGIQCEPGDLFICIFYDQINMGIALPKAEYSNRTAAIGD